MRRLFRKLVHHYRKGGAAGLVRKSGEYARSRCWSESRWVIYARDLSGDVPRVAQSVIHRELGLEELARLGYFKAKEFPEEIGRRFGRGNACHGFFLGDRLATIGWSSRDHLELDRNLEFPCAGAAGLFDFVTFEEFRARGCYTNALMQLSSEMRRAGCARAYIAVDPGNAPSIKGIERAGFLPALRITRRWRFGVSSVVRNPVAIRPG